MNKNGTSGFAGWFKLYYDKIIVVVLLVGLVFSLLYLALKISMIRKEQEAHKAMIGSYNPKYPEAKTIDSKPYEKAMHKLEHPFQLEKWTNAIFVPQDRVWCVDCRRPIHYDAMVCSFCGAKQPIKRKQNPLWDTDGDGIPDLWELKNHMDPTDQTDIYKDNDGDGFSNIVEFNAAPHSDLRDLNKKHGTGINDPNDFPPPINLLVVEAIGGTPFNLRFKANTTMPDGSIKFQINLKGNRTIMAKLGDSVDGFKLVDYKKRIVKENTGTLTMRVDKSILTIRRGKKKIMLVKNQQVPYTEYTAKLKFTLNGDKYLVKNGKEFVLKGTKYRVKSINNDKKIVVVIRLKDKKEFVLVADRKHNLE